MVASTINDLLSNTNPYSGNNNPVSLASNSVSHQVASSNSYYVREKSFIFSARGLKPSTRHYFYFGNTDFSSNCAPLISSNTLNGANNSLVCGNLPLGSPLVSDNTGAIKFAFFMNSGLLSNTNFAASQILANNQKGPIACTIKTLDGSSSSTMTLNIITGIINTSINFSLPVLVDATGNTILSAPPSAFN